MSTPEKRLADALASAETNRYELTERLREESKQLEGVRARGVTDASSLCLRCHHAVILRQASRNTQMIRCEVLSQMMPEDVMECSRYQAITTLSLSQMVEIATLLNDQPNKYRGYL